VETFILKHVLGVMADFTNPIENQLGNHHLTERRRCVGAIKELVMFAREDSCHALTQVRRSHLRGSSAKGSNACRFEPAYNPPWPTLTFVIKLLTFGRFSLQCWRKLT
jgi:hypothetical protein